MLLIKSLVIVLCVFLCYKALGCDCVGSSVIVGVRECVTVNVESPIRSRETRLSSQEAMQLEAHLINVADHYFRIIAQHKHGATLSPENYI